MASATWAKSSRDPLAFVAPRETLVLEVGKLMRRYHVGDIVITDEAEGRRLPVRIVTGRDIVVEVSVEGIDARKLSVGIMSNDQITVRENEGALQTIQRMRAKGARRAQL